MSTNLLVHSLTATEEGGPEERERSNASEPFDQSSNMLASGMKKLNRSPYNSKVKKRERKNISSLKSKGRPHSFSTVSTEVDTDSGSSSSTDVRGSSMSTISSTSDYGVSTLYRNHNRSISSSSNSSGDGIRRQKNGYYDSDSDGDCEADRSSESSLDYASSSSYLNTNTDNDGGIDNGGATDQDDGTPRELSSLYRNMRLKDNGSKAAIRKKKVKLKTKSSKSKRSPLKAGATKAFGKPKLNIHRGLLPVQSPRDNNRLCVVLDMDETLLHSRFTKVGNNFRQEEYRPTLSDGRYDYTLCFDSVDCREQVFVSLRPHVRYFLAELSKYFEPIVFTAALPEYASPVIDELDKDKHIRHRLFRQHTAPCSGHDYVKDLSKLGRDMGRIVLLDNSPIAMLASPDNAIPIASWFDNRDDNELKKVLQLLHNMRSMKDVRPYLKSRFNMRGLLTSFTGGQK